MTEVQYKSSLSDSVIDFIRANDLESFAKLVRKVDFSKIFDSSCNSCIQICVNGHLLRNEDGKYDKELVAIRLKMLSMLIYKVDLNHKNIFGNTALHISLFPFIPPLLTAGANPNIQNNFGDVPLHQFCKNAMNKADFTIIRALLMANANPLITDNYGYDACIHLGMEPTNFTPEERIFFDNNRAKIFKKRIEILSEIYKNKINIFEHMNTDIVQNVLAPEVKKWIEDLDYFAEKSVKPKKMPETI